MGGEAYEGRWGGNGGGLVIGRANEGKGRDNMGHGSMHPQHGLGLADVSGGSTCAELARPATHVTVFVDQELQIQTTAAAVPAGVQ